MYCFSLFRACTTDGGSSGLLCLKSKWWAPSSIITATRLSVMFLVTPPAAQGSRAPLLWQENKKQKLDKLTALWWLWTQNFVDYGQSLFHLVRRARSEIKQMEKISPAHLGPRFRAAIFNSHFILLLALRVQSDSRLADTPLLRTPAITDKSQPFPRQKL